MWAVSVSASVLSMLPSHCEWQSADGSLCPSLESHTVTALLFPASYSQSALLMKSDVSVSLANTVAQSDPSPSTLYWRPFLMPQQWVSKAASAFFYCGIGVQKEFLPEGWIVAPLLPEMEDVCGCTCRGQLLIQSAAFFALLNLITGNMPAVHTSVSFNNPVLSVTWC